MRPEHSLLHVVPGSRLKKGGVGSFAATLAGALEGLVNQSELMFVDEKGAVRGPQSSSGSRVIARRAAQMLLGESTGAAPRVVVLHYVNYGYQKRGCPLWLIRGFSRLLGDHPATRIVTIFHEVSAFGPPWRSSFWLSPVQRWLARRMLALSEAAVTSLPRYVALLGGGAGAKCRVLPVFSTVGELRAPPAFEARDRALVVFGGSGVRERAYRQHRDQLDQACGAVGAHEIVDIGPPLPETPETVAGRPVRVRGVLGDGEVSRELSRARAGFVAYPPAFLAKSTIFAAYCAHGVVPVVAWDRPQPAGSPSAGAEFIDAGSLSGPVCAAAAAGVAGRAHTWYGGHTVVRYAGMIAELLGCGSGLRP